MLLLFSGHANIVKCFGVGKVDSLDSSFFVLEYLPHTLAKVIDESIGINFML